jgi:hypothetical protein
MSVDRRVILLVSALRPVYAMRDIKIIASFFLGFGVQWLILTPFALAWNPVSISLDSLEPLLSVRLIEMLPNSSSAEPKKMMTYPICLDELAYCGKMPQRSEMVALQAVRIPARAAR